MGKMKDLRAGVAEMRSVARRLYQWADDLEASFRDQGEEPTTASGGNIVGSELNRNKRSMSCAVREAAGPRCVRDTNPQWGVLPRAVRERRDCGSAVRARNQSTIEDADKALTLPEVRTILAAKCAAGFGTQVKALIESYGATSLKGVPADRYGELLEAVKELGDADAG